MKNFKKIMAVMIAAALVFAMGITVFAEQATDPAGRVGGTPLTTKSITLTNPSAGHQYTLYQVFTGTYSSINGEDTLGDIAWGNGITDAGKTALGTASTVADAIVDTAEGAQNFAISVDSYLTNGSAQTAGTEAPIEALTWSGLSEGYYIIKDTTANLPAGEAADAVVVQVLDNVSIEAKTGTTTFDKQVRDRNDSTQAPEVYDAWGNTSDYDIDDSVPYQVTITLPANFTSYTNYTMTVKDKMDAGLSFNNDVAVYVGDSTEALTSGYEVVTTGLDNNETFEVRFADVKKIEGVGNNVTFTVTYSAKLTGDKVVYGNPGNKNEAWLTYSNNPSTNSTGDSVHKTTVTFTYKFEVDKTDGTNPLPGAEFALEKQIKNTDGTTSWKTLSLIQNDAGTVFTFDGLDDGFYRISETKTPSGYNSIDPIYFVVTAEHSDTLTSLVVKQAGEDGKELDTTDVTANFNVTLTKIDSGKDAGLIDTEVVNRQGSTLPSTGGIGTTIFYIIGGCVILAAVIFLVVRSKKSSAK